MHDKIKGLMTQYNEVADKKLYQERNYDEALEYAVRALQCAELIEDPDGILDNRLLIGHIYLNSLRNLHYAAEVYTGILDQLEEFKGKGFEDRGNRYYLVRFALGRTLRKLGKLNQAITLLEEVEQNIRNNVESWIKVLNDLGLAYWAKASLSQEESYLDEAIRVYDAAIEVCTQHKLDKPKAMVLNNKGMVYYDKHQYDLAIKAFNEALTLANDEYYTACTSNEIAKTYLKIGNFHMAKQYINKANQILIEYEEKDVEIELLRNLAIEGLYQRKIGNFEDAVNYFEMAATRLEDRELKIEAAETFHQLSLMLKERGDIRSGRYALKFEELAKEIENQEQKLV